MKYSILNSRSVAEDIESSNMVGVKGDEILGHRSIENAIEKRLAKTVKGHVAKDFRSSEHGETTQMKDLLNLTSAGGDMKVESKQQIGLRGDRDELEIDIHADSVAAVKRVQMLQKELMVLEDNHVFPLNSAAQALSFRLSTKQATSGLAEIEDMEKRESELEAYILYRLSWLQPSFRTLLEPGGGNSSGGRSARNMTKWNKKLEKVIAKVTNLGSKKKWEQEKKKRQVKQKTRWSRLCYCFCCCCSSSNNTERTEEDWEFKFEAFDSSW